MRPIPVRVLKRASVPGSGFGVDLAAGRVEMRPIPVRVLKRAETEDADPLLNSGRNETNTRQGTETTVLFPLSISTLFVISLVEMRPIPVRVLKRLPRRIGPGVGVLATEWK